MKYVKKFDNWQADYEYYLGLIGAFGLFFGHKVDKKTKRKALYIRKRLNELYYNN